MDENYLLERREALILKAEGTLDLEELLIREWTGRWGPAGLAIYQNASILVVALRRRGERKLALEFLKSLAEFAGTLHDAEETLDEADVVIGELEVSILIHGVETGPGH